LLENGVTMFRPAVERRLMQKEICCTRAAGRMASAMDMERNIEMEPSSIQENGKRTSAMAGGH